MHQNHPELEEFNSKFKETGDTAYIQQRVDKEFQLLFLGNKMKADGKTPVFKNAKEWFKKGLNDMMVMSHFSFSIDDTPETNIHLKKLNDRHIKVFGKPMKW